MFDTQLLKRDFSRAAAGYDASAPLQQRVRADCIALAESCWPHAAQILDAGCGTGALADETRLPWRITGLDIAPGMCAQARGREAVVNANAARMPFADGSFDGVFSSLMLQWADDVRAVFCEMARVMKPAGKLVLATLTEGTLGELREAFSAAGEKPPVTDFLPVPQVLAAMKNAGLTVHSADASPIVETYPNCLALMRSLKAIGASDKRASRRRGLMTPYRLFQVERAYARRHASEAGLPATWNVLTVVAGK